MLWSGIHTNRETLTSWKTFSAMPPVLSNRITGRSCQPGSITKMLKDLNLPSLQDRWREKHLILLYKIAVGLIPAIPAESFLIPVQNKRRIKTTSRSDFTSSNIIRRYTETTAAVSLWVVQKHTPTVTASSSELFLTGTASQKKWCLQSW